MLTAIKPLPKIVNKFHPEPAIAPKTQVLTIIELRSKKLSPDSYEYGTAIYDFKSIRLVTPEPIHQKVIKLVLKRNPDYRLHDLRAKDYNPNESEF
jgi:hypothetical protein